MKKPMKKFKRYDEGGSVEEAMAKQRGLDMSNKEAPVGFFERLRAGNIDEPGTEAYNRFGAGRGRATPAPAAPATPAAPAAPAAPSMPAASSRPLSDDMYSDFGPSAGRSSSETVTPTRPMATKPVVPARPSTASKPKPEQDRIGMPQSPQYAGPLRGMRSDATPPKYAGPMRGMRSDAGTSPPVGSGRRSAEDSIASQIAGQSSKAPQGEKIDSSETSRNVGNALMATGAAGLGALGAYKAKKMYDAAKAAKKASSTKGIGMEAKKLSGPRKASDVTDVTAKKHGGKVKKYASGGMVSSASKRADGIATKGKTRGKMC